MIKRILTCNEEPVPSDLAAITNDDGRRRACFAVPTLRESNSRESFHFFCCCLALLLYQIFLLFISTDGRWASPFPRIAAEHRRWKEIVYVLQNGSKKMRLPRGERYRGQKLTGGNKVLSPLVGQTFPAAGPPTTFIGGTKHFAVCRVH